VPAAIRQGADRGPNRSHELELRGPDAGRPTRALAAVVERRSVRRLRRCELFPVERTERTQGRVELEGGFTRLAHDDADGVAADFDDVGL